MASFMEKIATIRHVAQEFGRIPRFAETGWDPSNDPGFWQVLEKIESAGVAHDASCARWLAGLTQIDSLGPMGRDWFLSNAALAALEEMPAHALEAGVDIMAELPTDAPKYRKIGLCKVLEASGSTDAARLIQAFLCDSDQDVRQEAARALAHLGASEG